MKFEKVNTSILLALGITAYGLFLRYQRTIRREFWNDEFYQFECIEGPFHLIPIWRRVMGISGDHTTFPGEFLLNYPLVNSFGMNQWVIAIPHIFLTILGFFLLFKISENLFRNQIGLIVAFLIVCFNDTLIFHAFEFRPYGVLSTLALGSFYLSGLLVNQFNNLGLWKKVGIGAFFVVCSGYHAYGILIVFLPLLSVLIIQWKKVLKKTIRKNFFVYIVSILLLTIFVWSWYASINHFGVKSIEFIKEENVVVGANAYLQSREETFEYIPSPRTNTVGFLKTIFGTLIGFKPFYVLLLPMILSWMVRNKDKLSQIIFVSVLVFIPMLLILVVDLRSNYWFLQRQYVWVMPFFALYLGWCCESVWDFIISLRLKR